MTTSVAGDFELVDHALARVARRGMAVIHADGPERPDIFDPNP